MLEKVGGIEVPTGIAAFAPYLFVDNPVAAVVGREAFGFRKQWGSVTVKTRAR